MTERDGRAIREYLFVAGVRYMEFYEELYDHIMSSFIDRKDKGQTIDQHLELVISPEFGGTKGIEKMLNEQGKFISKRVYQSGWKVFHEFFTTPIGLLKTTVILTLLYSLQLWGNLDLIVEIGTPAIVLPFLFGVIAQWHFKRKCKAGKLAYKKSITNTAIFGLTGILIAIAQGLPDILSRLVYGQRFNTLDYLSKFEFLDLPLSLLLTLYAITCFTMITKRVRLKPLLS
ncbi:MAG: hypothetical protein ACJAVN_002737 [Roseivirga sp.]|jgi:hypothetical protein